jgi:hypothetical protein
MQISELIQKLQANFEVYGDIEVLVSSDEEGNSFSQAVGFSVSDYYMDGYSPEVLHPDDVEGYKEDGYTLSKALVIWP